MPPDYISRAATGDQIAMFGREKEGRKENQSLQADDDPACGPIGKIAQVSTNIIDQCVAQGVPFAREYGGLLDNRSFGGAQVSRTFYARGQTGQQLLLGAYQQLARQIGLGNVRMFNRTELVDVVTIEGRDQISGWGGTTVDVTLQP
mgnify:CR=1 FL=1